MELVGERLWGPSVEISSPTKAKNNQKFPQRWNKKSHRKVTEVQEKKTQPEEKKGCQKIFKEAKQADFGALRGKKGVRQYTKKG